MEDHIEKMTKESEVAGKLAPDEDLESMERPTELPIADPLSNAELQGNLLQEYEHKFEQLPEDQKLSKLCSDAGLKIVERLQFLFALEGEGPDEMKNLNVDNTRYLEAKKHHRVGGWILGDTKIGRVKVCLDQTRYGMEIMVESLFRHLVFEL